MATVYTTRPSSRLSGEDDTRTGDPVEGFGIARGARLPGGGRDAATRFSFEGGAMGVRATIDSRGIASFLIAPPLIIRSSILILADVPAPASSPFGEISGAAENWAGREPEGTTGIVFIGFNPTTAALRFDARAVSDWSAAGTGLPELAVRCGGGANTFGCGRPGSEPGPGRAATAFVFKAGAANAGPAASVGDGPRGRAFG